MVDINLTHLYPVLDRSGSMKEHVADTCGGFDTFIAAQRQLPGRCRVTLAQFDDQYEIVYADRDVNEVPPLTLVPRGFTALLDAIARTIIAAGRELATLPEDQRPGSVIVPILTDGKENASTEFTREQVFAMINEQTTKYSWLFTYIGANQDAIAVGRGLGIDRRHSMTYSQDNTHESFAAMAASTSNFRSASASGLNYSQSAAAAAYTEEDRVKAVADNETTTSSK